LNTCLKGGAVNRVIIGIDPGLSGAIGVITPLAYAVHDVPTLEVRAGKKKRNRYNLAEMVRLLKQIRDEAHLNNYPVELWLEDVHAMPGQGVTSMFSMGRGLGNWEMASIALEIPLNYISPITWKKAIMAGQGKEKDAAVYRAQQLFPSAVLTGPKGGLLDGRAEALLIAEYGRRFSISNF
jgi:crossover junction endodeoxyribonuclease RuvC